MSIEILVKAIIFEKFCRLLILVKWIGNLIHIFTFMYDFCSYAVYEGTNLFVF